MVALKSLLQLLHQVSLKEGTSHPLIVGGAVRDKVIGNMSSKFSDIDITTGDDTVFHLGKEFGIKLAKLTPITTKQGADGHISVYTPDLKVDFSSNFNVPNIQEILKNHGIKSATSMQREVYSRDFFCNTLLMSLDFRKIKDVTGQGIPDIQNKKIRTCLTPELSFKFNVKRIIRVVYLSCKLGFDVDPKIIDWVRNNPQYTVQAGSEYLVKNIANAMEYNSDRAVELINDMNLWKHIPITEKLYPYFARHTLTGTKYVK